MVRRDAGHPPNMALEHAPPNDEAAREFPLQDRSALHFTRSFRRRKGEHGWYHETESFVPSGRGIFCTRNRYFHEIIRRTYYELPQNSRRFPRCSCCRWSHRRLRRRKPAASKAAGSASKTTTIKVGVSPFRMNRSSMQ